MSLKARANTCKRLMDCVSEATALTGLKYIYPEKMFNDKHELNVEMILNKSDAGKVLSEALAVFDFVIIPTNVSKVFKIIPANELLDHPNLPTFQASKSKTPVIPKLKILFISFIRPIRASHILKILPILQAEDSRP